MFCSGSLDLKQLLANCICCALIPVGTFNRLLGSPNLYPTLIKKIKIIGAGDVTMQGHRVELCQDRDTIYF